MDSHQPLSLKDASSSPGGWLISADVLCALGSLDGVLEAAVAADDRELAEMARHLVARPGKRLRPALVLLAAQLGGGDVGEQDLLRAAAGVELLHIGSLYHDDIIDRAGLRRSVPSANYKWGEALAAVAGTYVTTRGVELLLQNHPILPLVSKALLELCTGQLQEAQNAFRLDMPPSEYLQIISKKTGSLFELPCHVGAVVADGPSNHLSALRIYGRHLGVAFQLADDTLDLKGDVGETGKLTGTDISEGVYSLPILLAAQADDSAADEIRSRLRKKRLNEDELAEIVRLLQYSGAAAAAFTVAEAHRDRALESLQALPSGPALDSLARLADYATSRSR